MADAFRKLCVCHIALLHMNAAKLINGAILGMDYRTIIVNGKTYAVSPPTIHKIAGAGYYLSHVQSGETILECLQSLNTIDEAAKALSWLIKGDESLTKDLSKGSFSEIVNGLDIALSLISTQDFFKLLGLVRNVTGLTAKQK